MTQSSQDVSASVRASHA